MRGDSRTTRWYEMPAQIMNTVAAQAAMPEKGKATAAAYRVDRGGEEG